MQNATDLYCTQSPHGRNLFAWTLNGPAIIKIDVMGYEIHIILQHLCELARRCWNLSSKEFFYPNLIWRFVTHPAILNKPIHTSRNQLFMVLLQSYFFLKCQMDSLSRNRVCNISSNPFRSNTKLSIKDILKSEQSSVKSLLIILSDQMTFVW